MPYDIATLADLVGGSGGAIGGPNAFDILTYYPPAGIGGHGGGAIEFVAVNDIHIGDRGSIACNGQSGSGGRYGGGGGSEAQCFSLPEALCGSAVI